MNLSTYIYQADDVLMVLGAVLVGLGDYTLGIALIAVGGALHFLVLG
ncbi:MAG: hypothetical protein AABW54_04805 [Candidatus Micrarchaeota archaeon]